jgi:WD40 repeat protein
MPADPNKLKIAKEISRREILFSVARVPESSRVFVGASDGKVYDLDVLAEKPEPVDMAGHEGYVLGLALAGKYVVSGAYDGRLVWWDAETHEQVRAVEAHERWIRGVRATPDGKQILSIADDMVCRVWDAASGQLVRELRGHQPKTPNHFPSMLFGVAVSPDSRLAATCDKVGHVVVWDLVTGQQLAAVETPLMYTWDPKQRIHSIGGARSVAFSPDAKLLAVGGMGQVGNIDHLESLARVEVFDWQKGERTHEFAGDTYKGLVERLEFHPQGDWLLAAGGDHGGFVKFFDLGTSKIIKQDKAPMHVHDFALTESADTLYAVGHGKLVVWELTSVVP